MARILVVDDDETVRTMLREALERGGHVVLEAANGDEGVRTYQRTACDLVILDLLMPDKEGLQTIRELRRDFPDIRIVAISGGAPASGVDYLQVARRLGARAALAKPFNLADLARAIDEALQSSRPRD
jgi:CheY-like chemotaxis protein